MNVRWEKDRCTAPRFHCARVNLVSVTLNLTRELACEDEMFMVYLIFEGLSDSRCPPLYDSLYAPGFPSSTLRPRTALHHLKAPFCVLVNLTTFLHVSYKNRQYNAESLEVQSEHDSRDPSQSAAKR